MTTTLTDRDRLALRAVDLAKALILADNHFLSAAIGRMKIVPGSFAMPFATNGFELGVNSELVCDGFVASKEPPKHDLLHTILHCVFLHPYVGLTINKRFWNLACDMAVERVVAEVCGQRSGIRGRGIEVAISRVEKDLGRRVSAEKVYNALCDGTWADKVDAWEALFAADDHMPWYMRRQPADSEGDADGGGRESAANGGQSLSGKAKSEADSPVSGDEASPDAGAGGSGAAGDSSQGNGQGNVGDSELGPGQGFASGGAAGLARSERAGLALREVSRPSLEAEKAGWRRVAKGLAVNLQTYSKNRGKALSGLAEDLEESTHERVDYADFLRQFAIPGEVLKVSEDEFDYIFYTYGLKLYGNLPLIEPLEYREEKRVREFVIVIDTSGSVWGDTVRRFIDTTFDILKSTEAFFERVHVHIIQCDAEVQSDDVITSLAELKEWGRTMRLYGSGGTDFRPAFAYVDKLVEDGAFENLGGLIYFTDGWGEYPEWMPDYKTAFVFYDENYRPEVVPTWAAQIVLDSRALDGRGGTL